MYLFVNYNAISSKRSDPNRFISRVCFLVSLLLRANEMIPPYYIIIVNALQNKYVYSTVKLYVPA